MNSSFFFLYFLYISANHLWMFECVFQVLKSIIWNQFVLYVIIILFFNFHSTILPLLRLIISNYLWFFHILKIILSCFFSFLISFSLLIIIFLQEVCYYFKEVLFVKLIHNISIHNLLIAIVNSETNFIVIINITFQRTFDCIRILIFFININSKFSCINLHNLRVQFYFYSSDFFFCKVSDFYVTLGFA